MFVGGGDGVLLATELARSGARFVVVGGTARQLQGAARQGFDLDIVVEPGGLAVLVGALDDLGVAAQVTSLRRCSPQHFATPWGPLDVFVGEGPPSVEVAVDDVTITVEQRP